MLCRAAAQDLCRTRRKIKTISAAEGAMSDDVMNPNMTPEEEAAAADYHRERLKLLGELPPATDPGDIRARNREKEELERRLREYEERRRARESGGETRGASTAVSEVIDTYLGFRANLDIAEAASRTMTSCSITPSLLVDAFNAGILDMSRSSEDAGQIHRHRNELLSHFNAGS